MTNQQTQRGEGIYFNMPAEEYFELPYFSRSLSQKVRFSGKEAEFYINNPTKETPAMELGTALHLMLLELDKFLQTYVKAPAITDEEFAGKKILSTVDDLKPYFELYGLKKSGKKEDLIDALRPYLNPAEVVIWDDIKSNFESQVKNLNQKVLSNEDYSTLEQIGVEFYNNQKNLSTLLKNGRPEVVIIWKDPATGVMCKCRLDYVQAEAIVDVKSFSIKDFNTPLIDQLRKKTIFSFYNFQYAIYAEAIEIVINQIKAGKAGIFGEDNQEFIDNFLKNPKKRFFILYVRTTAPYQMQALELEQAEVSGGGENAYYSVANQLWRASLDKYAHFLKTGKWKGEEDIQTLQDVHVPNILWQQPILEE